MSYEVIEHIEVGSGGAASIEFMSVGDIPAVYTDLQILISARSDRSGLDNDPLFVEFNGDTGASYAVRALRGSGSATLSFQETDIWIAQIPAATATGSTFANVSVSIPNYLSSNPKSISADGVGENNATAAYQMITAGLWDAATDTAITSIKIYAQNGNLVQYSSATLYGIRKYDTAGSAKATGGIISFDSANNKWVHTFTASGTFTPTENITCEYLVIAGGGAGGFNTFDQGGGGGAGGYRSSVSGESSGGGASAETPLSLTASTGYTVTVGAGGAANSNGSNSVFSTITSTGGGCGARESADAQTGGSGGGGTWNYSASRDGLGAAGTSSQGYEGGDMTGGVFEPASPYSGAGGGGAGGAGIDAVKTDSVAGAGGIGVQSSITGTAIYRAGGGGGGNRLFNGGAGGLGGGGTGNTSDGTVNTGGGGGGGEKQTGATNSLGGSGIVIVRYSA